MKIIFFSDLHSKVDLLEKLAKEEKGLFYCLGDSELTEDVLKKYNVISVKGNCDFINLPNHLVIELDNKKVLLLHGHTVGVKYDLNNLYFLTKSMQCDTVIFGHTHKEFSDLGDVDFYNPGSLRDGQTYLVYEKKQFNFKRLR